MFPRIYSREFTMGFAQRLAALRKERNLTQQALADKADLHIVQNSGHSAFEPGIMHELIEATDRFAKGVGPKAPVGAASAATPFVCDS